MKTLSNKAFNKFLNILAANGKSLTPERLSVILDADRDESIDAYFFGRLAGLDIVNEDKLLDLLRKNAELYICQGEELQSVQVKGVKIVSVGKIKILYTYTYAHKDENSSPMHSRASCTFLATDDEIDGIFDFVYKN